MTANAKTTIAGLGQFIYGWGFVQIALIGLAFFGNISTLIHGLSGLLITLAALILVIVSIRAGAGTRIVGLSLLTFAIIAGQAAILHLPGLAAIIRGLHPIFGMSVMFLGRTIAGQARSMTVHSPAHPRAQRSAATLVARENPGQ
ncbi:MAG: hypothetical protein EPO32_11610 [Anaerolineae bacterium]|nr:MAG: hypothetical protein EPO32_11610 [Anaerolineae bacterium]